MAYGNYAPFYRGGYFNPMQAPTIPTMAESQTQYIPHYQPQMQTPTQPTNDMIWVLNENEATSYPVAPNNSVVLWDKSNPTIYVKSVNTSGMPSMRVLDFTERTAEVSVKPSEGATSHKCTCGDKFVTKVEFDALKGKFYDLQARYDTKLLEEKETTIEKPKTTNKKVKESEE